MHFEQIVSRIAEKNRFQKNAIAALLERQDDIYLNRAESFAGKLLSFLSAQGKDAAFAADAYLGAVLYYPEVRLGYALDLNKGLRVVNMGDLASRPLKEISAAIIDFSKLYIRGKLGVEHLTGMTFSVTDVSAENVFWFTPLIGKNQSAILGICSMDEDGCFVLTLTFDHRVALGKTAARFLNDLKKAVEGNAAEPG